MIILYDSEETWREVVDEYPAIGGVWIRGDWKYEYVEGVKVPVFELTPEPVVIPAIANDGRRLNSHAFDEDALAAFSEYWSEFIAAGKVRILDSPPADWKPEGWVEAPEDGDEHEDLY